MSLATLYSTWWQRQFLTNQRPRSYLTLTNSLTQNKHTVRPCFTSSACKNVFHKRTLIGLSLSQLFSWQILFQNGIIFISLCRRKWKIYCSWKLIFATNIYQSRAQFKFDLRVAKLRPNLFLSIFLLVCIFMPFFFLR